LGQAINQSSIGISLGKKIIFSIILYYEITKNSNLKFGTIFTIIMPFISKAQMESVRTFQKMSLKQLDALKNQNFFKVNKSRIVKKIEELPGELKELFVVNPNADIAYVDITKRVRKALMDLWTELSLCLFPDCTLDIFPFDETGSRFDKIVRLEEKTNARNGGGNSIELDGDQASDIPSISRCGMWCVENNCYPTLEEANEIMENRKKGYKSSFIYGKVWRKKVGENPKIEFKNESGVYY